MASAEVPSGAMPMAFPDFQPPTTSIEKDSKSAHSVPDSSRRHSLPAQFLPPSLWSNNVSSASLVESEEAARGEHILDEASVAHRISALRQLNGATRSRHRYAKSTGARNSTFSQPVIVRTYSGTVRPPSRQRNFITIKKDQVLAGKSVNKMDLKLPPVEAFTFKGIMEEIRHGVSEDLERIAEICARSKYSLSNQYEVHMPPHGRGDPIIQTVGHSLGNILGPKTLAGPTLQAIGSDDEQPRQGRVSRGNRRTRSAAYGTLETIMSSSRSSDEDKTKKKSAAELAEEVRGRAAKKVDPSPHTESEEFTIETPPEHIRPIRHARSKSASFASIVIDNAHNAKQDAGSQVLSSTPLISEPSRPQTSTAGLGTPPAFGERGPHQGVTQQALLSKPAMLRNRSSVANLRSGVGTLPTILESLSSWLPWVHSDKKTATNAEGSLRHLLKAADIDKKGKGPSRAG